jgi:pimeloyl-ACP methyl ester carboxylesterase
MATSTSISEHNIHTDAGSIPAFEAGQGNSVILLRDAAASAPTAFELLLAEKFRVVALTLPHDRARPPRDEAHGLAQAVHRLGIERYALIAGPSATSQALWQTIDDPDRVEALVLISPSALAAGDSEPRLGDVARPTLVLVGTNDERLPATTGQTYVEQIGECYHMLVYDAGNDIAAERPAALFEAVADFVERRGAFVVERRTSIINP